MEKTWTHWTRPKKGFTFECKELKFEKGKELKLGDDSEP